MTLVHGILTLLLFPVSFVILTYSLLLWRRGRRKTSLMLDMVYHIVWLAWTLTGGWTVWFAPVWIWLLVRTYKQWKNTKDDDDENKRKAFRTAGSRVKKYLVQKMRKMKPSPLRLPMPQPV